jgi:hypothetical protein
MQCRQQLARRCVSSAQWTSKARASASVGRNIRWTQYQSRGTRQDGAEYAASPFSHLSAARPPRFARCRSPSAAGRLTRVFVQFAELAVYSVDNPLKRPKPAVRAGGVGRKFNRSVARGGRVKQCQ